ncbi:MAG: N-acetylmuramoyl-L-alanine amidase [Eggerthellaceae bacterium]|nr:N-acetylmuramoyl-L-alanine amidase [Eggerthellaceae bacterium]
MSIDPRRERMETAESASATSARKRDLPIWAMLGVLALIGILVIAAWMIAGSKMPSYVGEPLVGEAKEQVISNNSPLTDYVYLTQNADYPRDDWIKKITIHHMAGDLELDRLGQKFARRDTQASSNYGIDSEGNVALYVEEANRAWTSNNRANDEQAITIEVANDEMYGDWHVSDAAFSKLVELCADICRRNGIDELVFSEDGTGNLNYHGMMDASTECPGPYLKSRMQDIADAVNEKLAQ